MASEYELIQVGLFKRQIRSIIEAGKREYPAGETDYTLKWLAEILEERYGKEV